VERRPRQSAHARIGSRTPVVDARRRHVADPPARGAQAPLPVLLVARPAEPRVEGADALERGAPNGQVRAPGELGVAVLGAEVERGQRQRLAPARAQAPALEPRPDRPAERLVLRARARRRQQRVQVAGPRLDVVVEEAQQLARGRVQRRVARHVDPARRAVREVAAAVGGDEPLGLGVGGVVLDHHDLRPVLGGLGRDGGERDRQVVAPAAGREQEGGGRAHAARA
jgi:hypothetical protein